MAKIKLLVPKILKWEGGYVNHPNDKGGCTNMGVTLAAYQQIINPKATCVDIKNMTADHFEKVLKTYWDRWRADEIVNQPLAELLVDWVWGSGVWGIKIPQRYLRLTADGVVGPKTLAAINNADPKILYEAIWGLRKQFLNDIVRNDTTQNVFLKGWMNRLNDYQFEKTAIA